MTIIREQKQIAALASPVRLAVIDALEAVGPCSVSELGRVIGTRPDALYYHLRILEKQGLLKQVTENAASDTYDVTSRPLALAYEPGDRKNRDAVVRVAGAMLRGAQRMFEAAFRPPVRVRGPERELWAAQRTARLTKKQLRRVNELLGEVLDVLAEARDGREGEDLYSVTFVLSPRE